METQVAISNEFATSQVPALAGSGLTRVMAESPSSSWLL